MFEDGAIVDHFIQAWRKSGKQVSPLCVVTMATYHAIDDYMLPSYKLSVHCNISLGIV